MHITKKTGRQIALLLFILSLILTVAIVNNDRGRDRSAPVVQARIKTVAAPATVSPNIPIGMPVKIHAAAIWSAAKFRKGKMGPHSHGVPTRLYKHPAKVHAMVVAAVKTYYKKHPHKKGLRKVSATQRADALWNRASCVHKVRHNVYYAPYSTGFNVCHVGPKATRHDVQKIGAVTICGAAVAVAIVSEGLTMAVGFGAIGCPWEAWMLADPGN